MTARLLALCAAVAALPAFAPEAAAQGQPAMEVRCQPMVDRMKLEGRLSPYDSVLVVIDGHTAKICYGRPSARGRTMIGGQAVPYGKLWRTGANEPTTIHIPFPASIGDIQVEPGSYSIYTIPGEKQWVVIVNRSTTQWGHEGQYTPELQAQEVGRDTVASERMDDHTETFTIRSAPAGPGKAELVLEWERTRVRIPVTRLGK